MSKFTPIAPNLQMSDSPFFGDYNREVVFHLLRSVDINFSEALGIVPFSARHCLIDYIDTNPMCCNMGEQDCHLIFLHTTGNYWSKWLYQFAHEYCHHLIGGTLEGDLRGLMWFEETLCEVASMYHLYCAGIQWASRGEDVYRNFAPSHRSYLDDLSSKHPQLYAATARQGFLSEWEQTLSEPVYHRDYYNAIAVKIAPLFLRHPPLWKTILHLGDMRQWGSLGELFDHLQRKADSSYSNELSQLRGLLFY